jgi:hypothetical protein
MASHGCWLGGPGDKTVGRLRCRLVNGEDVERRHRSRESLECELADRLRVDVVLDLRVETLRDENLFTGRLVGEPRGLTPRRSRRAGNWRRE